MTTSGTITCEIPHTNAHDEATSVAPYIEMLAQAKSINDTVKMRGKERYRDDQHVLAVMFLAHAMLAPYTAILTHLT